MDEQTRKDFEKIKAKHDAKHIINDYFPNSIAFRVFGWTNGKQSWYDCFATNEAEAEKITTESIADFEFDEAIRLPA